MSSRFGPFGSFVKRLVARGLRFITMPQDERIARLEQAIDAAQRQNRTDVASAEDRVDAAVARIAETERRLDEADVAALRLLLEALTRDMLALRSRLSVLEATLSDAVGRADLAALERTVLLRLDADADDAAAHRSFVEREAGRMEESVTARFDSMTATVAQLSSVLEATASFCTVAGALGLARGGSDASGPLASRFDTELRQFEQLLGSIRNGRAGKNGRSDALRP